VASPVYSERDDLVVITAGFPEYHTLAIKADGQGKVGAEKVAWRTIKGAVYVPSPIIEGPYFLIISEGGVAHCFETKTGRILWQERMGTHHASLVSANGLVYFLNDFGVMNVIKPGPEFERVAQNDLGEKTFASPALSGGRLFIRGDKHLFCVGR
jgi:outer membrane protein assembly factor BamB